MGIPKILLVGATGNFGSRVLRGLLSQGASVRLFVRDAAKLQGFAKNCESVEGDYLDVVALERALQGIDVVISGYGSTPHLILEGQLILARVMEKVGVKNLMVGSYNSDWRKLNYGDVEFYDYYKACHDQLVYRSSINTVFFFCGVFMESFFGAPTFAPFDGNIGGPWNAKAGKVDVWGSGNDVWQMTSATDVATAVAEVALDAEAFKSTVSYYSIYGEQRTVRELVELYKSVKKVDIEIVERGSLDDLAKHVDEQRDTVGKAMYYLYLGYTLQLQEYTKRMSVEGFDNNRFNTVKWTSVKKFLEDTDWI